MTHAPCRLAVVLLVFLATWSAAAESNAPADDKVDFEALRRELLEMKDGPGGDAMGALASEVMRRMGEHSDGTDEYRLTKTQADKHFAMLTTARDRLKAAEKFEKRCTEIEALAAKVKPLNEPAAFVGDICARWVSMFAIAAVTVAEAEQVAIQGRRAAKGKAAPDKAEEASLRMREKGAAALKAEGEARRKRWKERAEQYESAMRENSGER